MSNALPCGNVWQSMCGMGGTAYEILELSDMWYVRNEIRVMRGDTSAFLLLANLKQ